MSSWDDETQQESFHIRAMDSQNALEGPMPSGMEPDELEGLVVAGRPGPETPESIAWHGPPGEVSHGLSKYGSNHTIEHKVPHLQNASSSSPLPPLTSSLPRQSASFLADPDEVEEGYRPLPPDETPYVATPDDSPAIASTPRPATPPVSEVPAYKPRTPITKMPTPTRPGTGSKRGGTAQRNPPRWESPSSSRGVTESKSRARSAVAQQDSFAQSLDLPPRKKLSRILSRQEEPDGDVSMAEGIDVEVAGGDDEEDELEADRSLPQIAPTQESPRPTDASKPDGRELVPASSPPLFPSESFQSTSPGHSYPGANRPLFTLQDESQDEPSQPSKLFSSQEHEVLGSQWSQPGRSFVATQRESAGPGSPSRSPPKVTPSVALLDTYINTQQAPASSAAQPPAHEPFLRTVSVTNAAAALEATYVNTQSQSDLPGPFNAVRVVRDFAALEATCVNTQSASHPEPTPQIPAPPQRDFFAVPALPFEATYQNTQSSSPPRDETSSLPPASSLPNRGARSTQSSAESAQADSLPQTVVSISSSRQSIPVSSPAQLESTQSGSSGSHRRNGSGSSALFPAIRMASRSQLEATQRDSDIFPKHTDTESDTGLLPLPGPSVQPPGNGVMAVAALEATFVDPQSVSVPSDVMPRIRTPISPPLSASSSPQRSRSADSHSAGAPTSEREDPPKIERSISPPPANIPQPAAPAIRAMTRPQPLTIERNIKAEASSRGQSPTTVPSSRLNPDKTAARGLKRAAPPSPPVSANAEADGVRPSPRSKRVRRAPRRYSPDPDVEMAEPPVLGGSRRSSTTAQRRTSRADRENSPNGARSSLSTPSPRRMESDSEPETPPDPENHDYESFRPQIRHASRKRIKPRVTAAGQKATERASGRNAERHFHSDSEAESSDSSDLSSATSLDPLAIGEPSQLNKLLVLAYWESPPGFYLGRIDSYDGVQFRVKFFDNTAATVPMEHLRRGDLRVGDEVHVISPKPLAKAGALMVCQVFNDATADRAAKILVQHERKTTSVLAKKVAIPASVVEAKYSDRKLRLGDILPQSAKTPSRSVTKALKPAAGLSNPTAPATAPTTTPGDNSVSRSTATVTEVRHLAPEADPTRPLRKTSWLLTGGKDTHRTITKQIEALGGKVLSDWPEMFASPCGSDSTLRDGRAPFVSCHADTVALTTKVLAALSAGVPIVSGAYITDIAKQSVDWRSYLLSPGRSSKLDGACSQVVDPNWNGPGWMATQARNARQPFRGKSFFFLKPKGSGDPIRDLAPVCLHALGAFSVIENTTITTTETTGVDYILIEDRKTRISDLPPLFRSDPRLCNIQWLKECIMIGAALPPECIARPT